MITLDLSFINNFLGFVTNFINMVSFDIMTAPNATAMIYIFLFKYYGWVLYAWIVLRYLLYPEYIYYIENRWFYKTVEPILLAIDVPKQNEQSVQAMENLFDHLLGAHGAITLWGKYIVGEYQLSFSCELVSIEGNIQFLIRTPKHWRNLVESAVYGQFPDAEITEVNDYVAGVPRYYPNDTHELYGCEFSLSNKNYALPIKTWEKFEHKFTEVFVDPMAALLETMSQIGPGEQIWIQYIIKPLPVDWGKAYQKEIDKVTGKTAPPKSNIISSTLDQTMALASEMASQVVGSGVMGGTEEKKKEELPFKILNLTPGQREQLEAMEHKVSKLAYATKIRYIYSAEKGKMNKAVGVNGLIGSFKQWTDMNGNGLKPMLKETGTNSPGYILIEWRRNTRRNYLMGAYRGRDTIMGISGRPMTSEELASIWHFPGMSLKAPFVKTTAFKKAAAPVSLPLGSQTFEEKKQPRSLREVMSEKTTVVPTFDYDNDEFEKQFAKDRASLEPRTKSAAVSHPPAVSLPENKSENENMPDNLPFID